MRVRIGVDVGGTKIEGIVLRGSDEIGRMRVATPADDYPGTVEAIAGVVSALEQQVPPGAGLATVGVGIPGTISSVTGLVKNANSVCLIGRPLREDLEARLVREVRLANDANCFAASEATDGAAAGAGVVFAVIAGTGIGAGITVNGAVLAGANGIAGEWGHNPLPWPDDEDRFGPDCYCGRRNCIETFLSGPGLSFDYACRTGRELDPPEIVAAAAAGDSAAEATLQRYDQRMARALAAVINVLDPDVIVIGGGLSNLDRLYSHVPRLWSEYIFACGASTPAEAVRTRLVRAAHGDASGVRGAAWLWSLNDE